MLRYRARACAVGHRSNWRFPKVSRAAPGGLWQVPVLSESPQSLPAGAHTNRHTDARRNAGIAASPLSRRQDRSIAKTEMRTVIQNRNVALAQQPGDGAESAAKTAVEKHCILAAKKFRDAPFELAMEIGHA